MRPQQTDDTELIRRCLANDQAAYRLLLEKYSRPVYSIVWRMVRDEEDARDLAQETFVKAFRSLGTFELGRSFSSWVFKIAMNLCVDFHRKRKVPTVSLSRPESEDHDEEFRDVEDLTPGPDADYEEREAEGRMDRIIRSLPTHYREVILLRHRNQFSYEEIADILSLPIGTVKARLHRAHLLLRSKLAPGEA